MLIKKIDYANIVPDRYAITDQGTVYDLKKNRPVSYEVDKDGYYRVSLWTTANKRRRFGVHRLVAIHFCVNEEPSIQNTVNHLNGEKKFNFASNLEWTTSAKNTRHAIDMGLRNYNGSGNPNSYFSEDFVRAICEEFQKGRQPIDVFRDFYPDTTVDGYDEGKLYRLLYALKKRKIWDSVTKDYTYDTSVPRSNNKIFKPKDHISSYTEDDVRLICELLEQGMTPPDIVDTITNTPGCSFANRSYPRKRLLDIIGNIARGQLWKSISRDYDIASGLHNQMRYSVYEGLFDREMAEGTDPHKIPSKISSEVNRGRGVVRYYFRRYLIERGLLDRNADDYVSMDEAGC